MIENLPNSISFKLNSTQEYHWIHLISFKKIEVEHQIQLSINKDSLIYINRNNVAINNIFFDHDCFILAPAKSNIDIEASTLTSVLIMEIAEGKNFFTSSSQYFIATNNISQDYLKLLKILEQASNFEISRVLFSVFLHFEENKSDPKPPSSEVIEDALKIINTEFPFTAGVEDLSEQLGVDKSHLIRQFNRELGETPGKILENTRIEYAKLLLVYRNYSLEIIAEMIGYTSSNYFGKVFTKAVGISPGRYRKNFSNSPLNEASQSRLNWLENIYLI